MMDHEAILRQIPDYVLGLLSEEEQQRIEHHASGCRRCAAVLQQEKQLVSLVQRTVQAATEPAPARLFRRMPQPPKSRAVLGVPRWQQALAPVLVMLMMAAGGFFAQLSISQQDALYVFGLGGQAVTVTASETGTPMATMASLPHIPVALEFRDPVTAQATPLAETRSPVEEVTPAPLPTPVAAIYQATLP